MPQIMIGSLAVTSIPNSNSQTEAACVEKGTSHYKCECKDGYSGTYCENCNSKLIIIRNCLIFLHCQKKKHKILSVDLIILMNDNPIIISN